MSRHILDRDATFAAVRAALLASYSGALASTRMSPIEAFECLAAAMGSIYREVADAHLDPQGCQCGWQPHDLSDIIALQQAIAANAVCEEGEVPYDLLSALPVGHG